MLPNLVKKTTKVVLSNQLINGRRKPQFIKTPSSAPYSVNTQRLLALLVSQGKLQKDKTFAEISIKAKELWGALGLKYRPTKDGVLNVLSDALGVIWWVRKKSANPETPWRDSWDSVRWVEHASYDEGTGKATLRLSTDLIPHMIGLKQEFTQFYIYSLSQLRSPYSVSLYRFLRQFTHFAKKSHVIELDSLLAAMDVPRKSRYTTDWVYFASDVLRPAVQKINENTELSVSYSPLREDDAVVAVVFRVKENKEIVATWHRADKGLVKINKTQALAELSAESSIIP